MDSSNSRHNGLSHTRYQVQSHSKLPGVCDIVALNSDCGVAGYGAGDPTCRLPQTEKFAIDLKKCNIGICGP